MVVETEILTKKQINVSMVSPNIFIQEPIIELEHIRKVYARGNVETYALQDISLKIQKGSFTAIIGASGSGKSTLLQIIGGLDAPISDNRQKLLLNGESLLSKNQNALAKFRAQHIGFVLQFFGLLQTLTVLENVEMAAYFKGTNKDERRKRTIEILKKVDLENRMHHHPSQLSGGQMQRVAIARALVNDPEIVLADEPTGNLDSKSGFEILTLLRNLVDEKHITLLLVTHDSRIYEFCDRIIEISDGAVIRDDLIRTLS